MRVQIVYCHPLQNSYSAALLDALQRGLGQAGHEVTVTDLYRDRFDPVLSPQERDSYYDRPYLPALPDYVERLLKHNGIVFCFPTWWSSMPAMLKGYVDRVWAPGVAFEHDLERGRLKPLLKHMKVFGVVTTYGAPWLLTRVGLRDPNRTIFMRTLKPMCGSKVRSFYLALYGMDTATAKSRDAFLDRVRRFAAAL